MQTLDPTHDARVGETRLPRRLTRRAALNTVAAGLDLVARVGVQLAVNPLLVGQLGDHLYGVWRVLWRFTGPLAASGGRSAQALKWSIANRQESADYAEKRELVGSAIGVWLLFLPLLVALGGGFAWLAPWLLDTAPEYRWSVRWAAALLVAYVTTAALVDIPRAILQGENLGYKRMGLSAFLVVLGGALMVLAVYLGHGIVGLAAANLLNALLTGLLFIRVVRVNVSWAGMARPTLRAVRAFAGLSWWFIVWKLVMQAMIAGDVLVLGVVDSVESVTMYSLTRFGPETVLALVAMLVSGIAPGLGGLVGSSQWSRAAGARGELMSTTWLLAVAAGATLVVWNQAFVELWVGGRHYAGTIETLLIVCMVTQFALIRNDANIIDLTLSIRGKVLLGVLSAVLSLGLAAAFLHYLDGGIIGLCLGVMAGRAILTIAYPLRVGRLFGLAWHRQLTGVLRPAAVTVALLALAFEASAHAPAATWPNFLIGSAVTFVAVAGMGFLLGLSSDGRGALTRRLRKVLHRVA